MGAEQLPADVAAKNKQQMFYNDSAGGKKSWKETYAL